MSFWCVFGSVRGYCLHDSLWKSYQMDFPFGMHQDVHQSKCLITKLWPCKFRPLLEMRSHFKYNFEMPMATFCLDLGWFIDKKRSACWPWWNSVYDVSGWMAVFLRDLWFAFSRAIFLKGICGHHVPWVGDLKQFWGVLSLLEIKLCCKILDVCPKYHVSIWTKNTNIYKTIIRTYHIHFLEKISIPGWNILHSYHLLYMQTCRSLQLAPCHVRLLGG